MDKNVVEVNVNDFSSKEETKEERKKMAPPKLSTNSLGVPGGGGPGLTVPGASSLSLPSAGNKSNLSVPSPGGLFPLPASQQIASSGSATGNARNKVGLKKGFGLMDWVRLTKSGQDLTGVGGPREKGRLREITKAELKRHGTKRDAWMAINGAVFNVTPYMDYHPGGWDELVRGAGMDATDLFNEVHRWVNYESLMAACLVGKLVEGIPAAISRPKAQSASNLLPPPPAAAPRLLPPLPPPGGNLNKSSQSKDAVETSTILPPINDSSAMITVSTSPTNKQSKSQPSPPEKPTFDYFQSDDKLTLNIYCKRKGLEKHNFIIDNFTTHLRVICLFSDKTGFIFHQQLYQPITSEFTMKLSGQGKLELGLVKNVAARWQTLGTPQSDHNWFGFVKDMKVSYRKYKIEAKEKVTHDTIYLQLAAQNNSHMIVPPGQHVHIKQILEGMEITRSYTPVTNFSGLKDNGGRLEFLIKIYKDGAVTPLIDQLNKGDDMEISDYTGDFSTEMLETSTIYLLAAGTGITPMMSILPEISSSTKLYLLNFNKTCQDVMWKSKLEEFFVKREISCQYIDIYSEENMSGSKSEYTGRISKELLSKIITTQDSSKLACICGPKGFVSTAERLLKEDFKFGDDQIHLFQG